MVTRMSLACFSLSGTGLLIEYFLLMYSAVYIKTEPLMECTVDITVDISHLSGH